MASPRKARRRHSSAAPIRIYTLGAFRLEAGGRPVSLPTRAHNRPLALLKTLVALGADGVPVEALCEHLWPDADGDHAIAAFNTTLLRLRRRIGPEAVRLAGGRVSLDRHAAWLDVREFAQALACARDALRGGDVARAAAALEAALALYRGAFLDGEDDPAPITVARDRLRSQLVGQIEETAAQLDAAGRTQAVIALTSRPWPQPSGVSRARPAART